MRPSLQYDVVDAHIAADRDGDWDHVWHVGTRLGHGRMGGASYPLT